MTKPYVIWADDEHAFFEASRDLLDGLECEVAYVADGKAAMAAAEARLPDMLLLDLQMPPGDRGGLWVLDQLKERRLLVPAVIVSNKADARDASDASMRGATFIVKEDVERDLATRVRRLLDQAAAQRGLLHEIVVRDECNGDVRGVGQAFWKKIRAGSAVLDARLSKGPALRSVAYVDNYVRSPLCARVLYEVVSALRGWPGGLGTTTSVDLRTAYERPPMRTTMVFDNWPDPAVLEKALTMFFRPLDPVTVCVRSGAKEEHRRALSLEWEGGEVMRIMPDKGFGFLRAVGQRRALLFDFGAPQEQQVDVLRRAHFAVENVERDGSPIYVDVESR